MIIVRVPVKLAWIPRSYALYATLNPKFLIYRELYESQRIWCEAHLFYFTMCFDNADEEVVAGCKEDGPKL